eukprot:339091-Amphidinium_carterae.1
MDREGDDDKSDEAKKSKTSDNHYQVEWECYNIEDMWQGGVLEIEPPTCQLTMSSSDSRVVQLDVQRYSLRDFCWLKEKVLRA